MHMLARRAVLAMAASVVCTVFVSPSPALAADHGSLDEAKAMAERAGKFLADNGKDKAFAAFTDGSDGFKVQDLYVYAYDLTGTCVAHGANRALVGKNLIDLKDVDGKPLIREIVATAPAGWVDYKWQNPQTKAIEQKRAYVVRSGDYVVGVGAYGAPK